MSGSKTVSRKVYEHNLGKTVCSETWKVVVQQMRQSGLPMIPRNLMFVAKLKSFAPRCAVSKNALNDCVELAAVLGDIAKGIDIKREIYTRRPSLTKHKFYWCFRREGFSFKEEDEYEVKYLAPVFYRLMGGRNAGQSNTGRNKTNSNKVK